MGKEVDDNGAGAAAQTNAAATSKLANQQAAIAKELFAQSAPIRYRVAARYTNPAVYSNAAVTSKQVEQSPLFPLLKQTAEQQYGLANDQAMASIPTGGSLNAALGDIAANRAQTMVQGVGAIGENLQGIRERELERAIGLATGTPSIALSGLGSAGSLLGQLQSSQAAQASNAASAQAGKNASLGTGLGTLGAAAIKK